MQRLTTIFRQRCILEANYARNEQLFLLIQNSAPQSNGSALQWIHTHTRQHTRRFSDYAARWLGRNKAVTKLEQF